VNLNSKKHLTRFLLSIQRWVVTLGSQQSSLGLCSEITERTDRQLCVKSVVNVAFSLWGSYQNLCVVASRAAPSLLIGSWMAKSARFILRRCKALRLKEVKGIICSKRKLARWQAQRTLFSSAEQWNVSHLRDLGLGYQPSLLCLLKILSQRMGMDK
jgi:hypothetical protein